MEDNRQFISEQKEQHCQEYFGCSLSEICHVIEKDDYISYLAKEMEKRNENTLLAKVDDDRTRMTIAKRSTEMLDEIMDEMHNASVYVHKHNLYPTGWSNIMRTYNELKQQEEQQKQQSIEVSEAPKPSTPTKSTRKHSL